MSQGSTNPQQQINGPELQQANTQTRVVTTSKKGPKTSLDVDDSELMNLLSEQNELLRMILEVLLAK